MTNYYRLMLGKGSAHAPECFVGRFVGTDFDIHEDLSGKLPDQWKDFNKLRFLSLPGQFQAREGLTGWDSSESAMCSMVRRLAASFVAGLK